MGLLGHGGGWSAVLALDPEGADGGAALVPAGADAASFPLAALAGCLADRGVVLDAVSALWHCRPVDEGGPKEGEGEGSFETEAAAGETR